MTVYWPWLGEKVDVGREEWMGVLWTDVVGVALAEVTGDMNGEILELVASAEVDVWVIGGDSRLLVAAPCTWCCWCYRKKNTYIHLLCCCT